MQISTNFSVPGVGSVANTNRNLPSSLESGSASGGNSIVSPVDQLDLSAEAQGLMASEALSGSDSIRVDKVAEIRRAIAEGTYDTEEKFSMAMDRLLDQIG